METNGVRINKFLSEAGVCSRREADRQVTEGNVTIDGIVAEMGAKVFPGQEVCFNGKVVSKEEEMIFGNQRMCREIKSMAMNRLRVAMLMLLLAHPLVL